MSKRSFDLHRAERRAEQIALVLVVAATKWTVLGLYRLDDARYALIQRRGARLARQMHRDGTLAARSPRKVVVRLGGAR